MESIIFCWVSTFGLNIIAMSSFNEMGCSDKCFISEFYFVPVCLHWFDMAWLCGIINWWRRKDVCITVANVAILAIIRSKEMQSFIVTLYPSFKSLCHNLTFAIILFDIDIVILHKHLCHLLHFDLTLIYKTCCVMVY